MLVTKRRRKRPFNYLPNNPQAFYIELYFYFKLNVGAREVFVCVSLCVCESECGYVHTNEGTCKCREKVSGLPETGLQVVVNCQAWVLELHSGPLQEQ